MPNDLPKEARSGRDKQRYTTSGLRLVAGIVALSPAKTQVLLVQSTRRPGWVLPKGGWETDEASAAEAAVREAWEEAGIVCTVTRDLGIIQDHRLPKDVAGAAGKAGNSLAGSELGPEKAPVAEYRFFEARVEREESVWPEQAKRGRKWMSWPEAQAALGGRRELIEALERSALIRN